MDASGEQHGGTLSILLYSLSTLCSLLSGTSLYLLLDCLLLHLSHSSLAIFFPLLPLPKKFP